MKEIIISMVLLILISSLFMGCTESIKPIYKTVEHKDPVYKTLYTYELDDDGDGRSSVIIQNVYDIKKEYTGSDFWGNSNYNMVVYYYSGLTKSSCNYYEMNSIDQIDSYQKIVSYNTWTEKVIVGYT